MSTEVTFVRHGETKANAAGIWQGSSDSELTDIGVEQAKRLGKRVEAHGYDLVVSSDLGRATATAGFVSSEFETDRRWRELHLGSWEGLTFKQVREGNPGLAEALAAGEDVSFGDGERLSELATRVRAAFDDLTSRLDESGRALVVTHGGALMSVVSAALGGDVSGRVVRLTNTALTTVRTDQTYGRSVTRFNDATHLPGWPVRTEAGATHVWVVRHGESEANVQRRWQGQQDGVLTPDGRDQAQRLSRHLPPVDAMYSSPLKRARDTADLLVARDGVSVDLVDGLMERSFGRWENMTPEEIAEIDGDTLRRLRGGEDVRSGANGETFHEVRVRVCGSVDRLVSRHRGGNVGVVTHGGASRALVSDVLGLEAADRYRLGELGNTALARIVYGEHGARLAAWNLSPHLAG